MKLTWFGGSAFRLYIGGRIIVTDAHTANSSVDVTELEAAADHVVDLTDGVTRLPELPAENWQRRRPLRLIDHAEEIIANLHCVDGEALFVDEPAEGPAIIAPAGKTTWSGYAENAVIILFGTPANIEIAIGKVMAAARPRLFLLAVEGDVDALFDALPALVGMTPVQLLEAGLAIEA